MTHLLAQVRLAPTTNLPRDFVQNTFSFDGVPGDAADIVLTLQSFYDSFSAWLSPTLSRANPSGVAIYDMSDPEPRAPIGGGEIELQAASSSTGLPNEVAVALSYTAGVASGENAGRRRGRVYIGPFVAEACDTDAGVVVVADQLVEDIATGAVVLSTSAITEGYPWQVWSRVDDMIRPIVGGWVDNEFDTQRRRGRDSTARALWVPNP